MPTKGLIQLPPDSTGKQVGTWTDADGKHYHGMVLVDASGDPIDFGRIVNLLENISLLLALQAPDDGRSVGVL